MHNEMKEALPLWSGPRVLNFKLRNLIECEEKSSVFSPFRETEKKTIAKKSDISKLMEQKLTIRLSIQL